MASASRSRRAVLVEISSCRASSGWGDDYRAAAHDVMLAWSDPAKLEQVLEVPWGASPGAALMFSYTAELAVHGWDLAKATGREFTIDDDLLHGALVAARWIPAEGRDTPEMPFSPVVDPGPDASSLDQMAGWMGRDVLPDPRVQGKQGCSRRSRRLYRRAPADEARPCVLTPASG